MKKVEVLLVENTQRDVFFSKGALLDINLPKIDSKQVARFIRSCDEIKQLHVEVICSIQHF